MTGEMPWAPGVPGDYSELTERVLAKAGLDVFENVATVTRFVSYLVMMQAIERAGAVDREKVRQALYKGTFKAPSGDITFDANGFPDTVDLTIQTQNGKFVVVWPPNRAAAKPQWPSPSWQ
jgi:ABC-type branched-subunit amino acid transport system substrate-binding protein